MQEALNYLYYIFDKYVDCVFNQLEIFNGVTIGWVSVAVIVFSMMITSILNIPRHTGSFSQFRAHTYSRDVSTDGNVYHTTVRSKRG